MASSLFARAVTYAASGFISQGAVFVLWLAIPWFLAPAEVGFLTLALFAVELLTMLGSLGMDAALIRFAVRPETRGAAFGVALALTGAAFALLVGLVPAAMVVGRSLLANTVVWVTDHYVLVVVAVLANIAWNLIQSVQIAGRQVRVYALLQIGRAVTQLVLGVCALALLERDAATALGAITFATLATLAVLVLRLRRTRLAAILGNPFHAPIAGPMARYGVSMMIYGALGVAVNYTQRLVVDHDADIGVLGVFAFFNVIVLQANGLWGALNKAWTPEFFALFETDRDHALELLRGMMALLCVVYPMLLAILVVAGEAFLARLVFPSAYAEQTVILWLLLLAMLFSGLYTIAYPIYYYEIRTRRILAITIILAIVNLALSIAFVRRWGAEGAAVSFLVLQVLSTWIYLSAFRDWVNARLPTLLAAVTMTFSGAGILLFFTRSIVLFVTMLVITSIIAWTLGGTTARPVARRLIKSIQSRL